LIENIQRIFELRISKKQRKLKDRVTLTGEDAYSHDYGRWAKNLMRFSSSMKKISWESTGKVTAVIAKEFEESELRNTVLFRTSFLSLILINLLTALRKRNSILKLADGRVDSG